MSNKYHQSAESHTKKPNWEMILSLSAIMLTSLGTTITLYVHSDNAANDRHRDTCAQIQAIHEEMKDFHGRLCAIEQRNKEKLK